MPEQQQPTPASTTPILVAVSTVGLGVVVSLVWLRVSMQQATHQIEQATDQREFLQEQLIETLQASAAASERVAAHIDESNDATRNFAVQIDDLGDEQRQLNRWIETMLGRGQEVIEAQRALQDEYETLE